MNQLCRSLADVVFNIPWRTGFSALSCLEGGGHGNVNFLSITVFLRNRKVYISDRKEKG